MSPNDYVAVLGPPSGASAGRAAAALASAHVASDGSVAMDVAVSGLSSPPLGNSELVLGPVDPTTATPLFDGDSVAIRPIGFSQVMPRPPLPSVRSPTSAATGITATDPISAMGTLAGTTHVALSEVLALGGSSNGDLGVLGTVVVRTASGVACLGMLERVGPAHGVFVTSWADSTTTGLLNDVVYSRTAVLRCFICLDNECTCVCSCTDV